MTASRQILMAAGSPFTAGRPWTCQYSSPLGSGASAFLTFASDGTITKSGGNVYSGTDGDTRWFVTAPPNVANYAIRVTATSGALTQQPAAGWNLISGSPKFGQVSATSDQSATVTFEIASSISGAPIVWRSPGNVIARLHG